MSTSAVIPIKQLEDAKQRLSGLLNSDERKLIVPGNGRGCPDGS